MNGHINAIILERKKFHTSYFLLHDFVLPRSFAFVNKIPFLMYTCLN